MRSIVSLIFVLVIFLGTAAHADIRADWDKISVETTELKETLTVTVSRENNKIGNIAIKIADKLFHIPKEDLRETKRPILQSLKIGYMNSIDFNFYIAMECGVISSFPNSPLPKAVFYIFKNGKYSHRKTYQLLDPPNLSLELYWLINKDE